MKQLVLKTVKLLILSLFMIFSTNLTAQVAINDDGTAPNGNAMLDIDVNIAGGGTAMGILIPRLTTAQRTGMTLAAGDEGLTIYDETTHRFYYWNGSSWSELTIQGANWSILGNTSIDPTVNFLGTTDAQPLIFSTNGTERARFLSTGLLGINTTTPDVYFHIFGDDGTDVGDDATYSNGTGLMVLGNISERNLVFDQNEILARNNGVSSSLYLQNRGGDIRIHYDRPTTTHDDGTQVVIKDDGKIGVGFLAPEDMIHIYNELPYIRFTDKDGGNSWNAGVYGNAGFQRFQITEYTGAATYRQRLVIKEGGFTGLGTVSPEGLLHIKADAGNDASFYIDANAGTDAADTWIIQSAQADNDLNFINNATTNVVFNATGYVGIGIDPSRVLHINNTLPYIRIQDTDGGNYWEVGNTSGEFRIYESHTDLRFEIEAGGNVGIGTDNPDAKLHVLGGGTVMGQYAGTAAAFQNNNATTDWSRISIIGGNTGASVIDFGDADKQDIGMLKYDHTDNYLSYTYNNSEILRIEDYGYVGIGETNPSEVLDVNGAIKVGTTANTNAGTIRWNGSNFQGYNGSTWKALDVQAVGGAGGWTDGGTDVYLTTTSDNVGIGTNTPNEKLEVNGHIRMTDGNQATGNVMVSDANGTASWSNENDGVKTRVIRQINGGNVKTVIYTHPENIEVSFNPSTELVIVENKSTDATHYWDVTIVGGATGTGLQTTNYKATYIRDDGTNDLLSFDLGSNNMGWFDIICSDQDNEQDGFIIHVVYFGDDLNGTVQYWDN